MLPDNVLGCEIVLKISHLPSKLCFSAKYSFFRQSLSHGHYQPTHQPPEGVYLLNRPIFKFHYKKINSCSSVSALCLLFTLGYDVFFVHLWDLSNSASSLLSLEGVRN